MIFWGNSTDMTLGKFNRHDKGFHNQNIIITAVDATSRKLSCRKIFRKFNSLPLTSKYLLAVCCGQHGQILIKFRYNIRTGHRYDLRVRNTNLSKYHKGVLLHWNQAIYDPSLSSMVYVMI